jgi:hypothetical protein
LLSRISGWIKVFFCLVTKMVFSRKNRK